MEKHQMARRARAAARMVDEGADSPEKVRALLSDSVLNEAEIEEVIQSLDFPAKTSAPS